MGALLWLLIPLFAAIAAAIYAGIAARAVNRKSGGDVAELAGYARFREAMERQPSDSDAAA
ncbi:hypothetical protein ADL28_44200 [Streptomyces violaceusniger]|uniref:Uncharacterized protein n=2 Tax=Streptomyces TaxID=1883 RepID=A0A0X3VDV7_STRVO|nr:MULTISPECIES: hypothetical protein [Streptomyces]RSS39042.1 hypothetical protein EF902_28730 [Streptomyces sp. WAC05858]KUL43003.1 hypothetical protein ADL28_44200 [Streptomyces violaceusniger]WJE02179.1 hypothetical protein QR300_15885 [Streptomyces antimycoticus]WTA87229.1 hypothetical protein OG751_30820 [Streptomyces antimycoticus]WTB11531.1 hypothetical protein OG546_16340 [Streptomyces antimycoticus]